MALVIVAVLGGIFFTGLGQSPTTQGTVCDINQCNNANTVNTCKNQYKSGFLSPNQLNQCLTKCADSNCAIGSFDLRFVDPWSYDKNKDCLINVNEIDIATQDWTIDVISLQDVTAIIQLWADTTRNPSCGSATTIPPRIDCYSDIDCGSPSTVYKSSCCNTNILCVNEINTPICYSKGTIAAYCGVRITNSQTLVCVNGCSNNQCLTTQPTTPSTMPSTTTTTIQYTTTTLSGGCVDGCMAAGGKTLEQCNNQCNGTQDYTLYAIIGVIAAVIIIYYLKIIRK